MPVLRLTGPGSSHSSSTMLINDDSNLSPEDGQPDDTINPFSTILLSQSDGSSSANSILPASGSSSISDLPHLASLPPVSISHNPPTQHTPSPGTSPQGPTDSLTSTSPGPENVALTFTPTRTSQQNLPPSPSSPPSDGSGHHPSCSRCCCIIK